MALGSGKRILFSDALAGIEGKPSPELPRFGGKGQIGPKGNMVKAAGWCLQGNQNKCKGMGFLDAHIDHLLKVWLISVLPGNSWFTFLINAISHSDDL